MVEEFAKKYKYRLLLNLEKRADKSYFEDYDEVEAIIESLFLLSNIPLSAKSNTILFIDEIQESPKAIQFLRYFYEEIPELHVVAAGSLLEFAMRKVKNFPVGRIEYLYLHPLNFPEYLNAIGYQSALEYFQQVPFKPVAFNVLLKLFHRYAIIGGMPEVINVEAQSNNLTELPKIYKSIWETYKNDVEKYTSNETERKVIKYVMTTAHLYIDQRIKFQNFGNSNYRSREVGEALRNLDDAKIIQLIYPTTDVAPPVKPNLRKSPRMQFLDTGLINHALGIQPQMLGLKDFNPLFQGAIIPHLITQELISLNEISNHKPNFWVRDKKQSTSEVDLVYSYQGKIIPIDIKSGSTGTLKSLHQFVEQSNHPYAIRIYAGEFKIEQNRTQAGTPYLLMNLPYFLGTKIPEYVAYFVANFTL